MPYQIEAMKVFDEVKKAYRTPTSLKSFNKGYRDGKSATDNEGSRTFTQKEGIDRTSKAEKVASVARSKLSQGQPVHSRGKFLVTHYKLFDDKTVPYMYSDEQENSTQIFAGNCNELADICCYRAKELINAKNTVWLVDLEDADHAFCVIGESFNNYQGRTIKELDGKLSEFRDTHVLDVWLNTFCTMDNFYLAAHMKCDSWTAKGKKIDTDKGWVVPKGDYFKQISSCPMKIIAV